MMNLHPLLAAPLRGASRPPPPKVVPKNIRFSTVWKIAIIVSSFGCLLSCGVANDEDKPFTVNTDMMQLKDMSHQLRGSGPGGEDTVPRQVTEYATSDNTLTGVGKEGQFCSGKSGSDAECEHKCTCGTCTNSAGKLSDGKKCDWKSECSSNKCGEWWQGAGCYAKCKPKKPVLPTKGKEGEACTNDAKCEHKCTCGTCTNSAGKLSNGKKCDKKEECDSNTCGSWWTPAVGCLGRCKKPVVPITVPETKGKEGKACTNDTKCEHKCTCGTCTNSAGKLPNGKKCDWKSECSSNTCGRWWQGAGCYAKCR